MFMKRMNYSSITATIRRIHQAARAYSDLENARPRQYIRTIKYRLEPSKLQSGYNSALVDFTEKRDVRNSIDNAGNRQSGAKLFLA